MRAGIEFFSLHLSMFVNKWCKCHSECFLVAFTWHLEWPVERDQGYNLSLLSAEAFFFVSILLIQSETTQHAKLKLAGQKKRKKRGVSEQTGSSISGDRL
jgi:hypothetical protein